MPDYEKLYHMMFNAVTDTIEELKELQIKVENEYLKACEEEEKQPGNQPIPFPIHNKNKGNQ